MTRFLTTVGTVALLMTGSAIAQTQTETTAEPMTEEMGDLNVIREQLQTEFTQLGVDIDPNALTDEQAREAYLIVSNSSLEENNQIDQLELLANE